MVSVNAQKAHSIQHQFELSATAWAGSALDGLLWQESGSVSNCMVVVDPPAETYRFQVRTPARSLSAGQFCWSKEWGTLVFQADGNFVKYVAGKAQWNSRTGGRGVRLAFQSDGNIVIYDASGAAIWATSMVLRGGWTARDLTHGNGYLFIEILQNSIYWETEDNLVHVSPSAWIL
jgi:hypothetical protein